VNWTTTARLRGEAGQQRELDKARRRGRALGRPFENTSVLP
jgi:hypothetical protein